MKIQLRVLAGRLLLGVIIEGHLVHHEPDVGRVWELLPEELCG